jgi:hypothetical protein
MSIDQQVQDIVKDIRTSRDKSWKGAVGEELRKWLNFADVEKVGKFDFEGLFALFDRKKINDDYAKARATEDCRTKDTMIPKLSADLLSGFQRDHLLRTRSRVRYMMHAASRIKADGMEEGPLMVNTITLLTRIDTAQEK